jgi:alkanesulfonate monooxygenase
MTTEILGMVGTKDASEIRGSYIDGSAVDADYLTRFAQAHEQAGFDRVLIGYSASAPDGFAVASHVLNATTRLKVLIAHRPGFVQPTVVARKLATLDQLIRGFEPLEDVQQWGQALIPELRARLAERVSADV